MMPYTHTKFQIESRQGAGLVSKRNTNREKKRGQIAKKKQKNKTKITGGKMQKKCEKNAKKREKSWK